MIIGPIRGYTPLPKQEWIPVSGGWTCFFNKDGKNYIIKQLHSPVYPSPNMQEPFRSQKLKECNDFVNINNEIIRTLKKAAPGTANIIAPIELFLENSRYYKVSLKVDDPVSEPSEIAKWSRNEILLFLKSILTSIEKVHNSGIVHGTLSPNNILVAKNRIGKIFSRIIDFDDSYFQGRPPLPSLTVGTPEYYSPELFFYKRTFDDETDTVAKRAQMITTKSDIFALGIIFWEFLTGSLPQVDGDDVYLGVIKKTMNGDTSPIIPSSDKLAVEELRPLLEEMMSFEPENRPSATDVISKISEL